jgi:oligoendopeptidase F
MSTTKKNGAENIHWDLGDLYASAEDPRLQQDLKESLSRAERLAKRFRGRLAALSAAELYDLLAEYEQIGEVAGKIGAYAYLAWSTDTEDAARGKLLQAVTEHAARLQQELLFVELEWAKIEDQKAKPLIAHQALAGYRHWLTLVRRYRPHLLSEPEEKILAEKAVTGKSAWKRYFEEVMGASRYELDGQNLPQQVVLSRLHDPDREARRLAAASLTEGMKKLQRTTVFIFNNILADKSSDDRLRGYPAWISARNLSNQTDDATVEALIAAVTSRYDMVARYYRLKRDLLGLPELYDYDRYAPLPAAGVSYTWEEARTQVLNAYGRFHPRLAELARAFFERRWIDAAVRPGKRGGAYSHGVVPSVHPYVFLNYQGTPRDVMTLAHELGHGVHQTLAASQGLLQAGTPLTTAETASVFGEMLVFQELINREDNPRARLSLLVQKIEDIFATVFRQVAMNRFEDSIHRARRNEGELEAERFAALWSETQEAMYADSVTLTDNYRTWWSYIPHFIHSPGYVYAYAFGQLLVLALYARFTEGLKDFPDLYLEMLAAGGSDWPERIVKPLGVDLKDPLFWQKGLSMIDKLVQQAEELAAD